ncbi:MAG: DinB family protein [Fibrobacteria bacterium]
MLDLKDSPFWKYFSEASPVPQNPAAALAAFTDHAEICRTYFASIPESKAGSRYAPEKWSVKQVVGHIADCNLVFLYRLVAIARGENQTLPGFDEGVYMANSPYEAMSWKAVLESHRGVSQAAGALLAGLDEAAWSRSGCAAGTRLAPRDLLGVIIGHERHHIGVLKDRYGIR